MFLQLQARQWSSWPQTDGPALKIEHWLEVQGERWLKQCPGIETGPGTLQPGKLIMYIYQAPSSFCGEMTSSTWLKKDWWTQVPQGRIVTPLFMVLLFYIKRPSTSHSISWNSEDSCNSFLKSTPAPSCHAPILPSATIPSPSTTPSESPPSSQVIPLHLRLTKAHLSWYGIHLNQHDTDILTQALQNIPHWSTSSTSSYFIYKVLFRAHNATRE